MTERNISVPNNPPVDFFPPLRLRQDQFANLCMILPINIQCTKCNGTENKGRRIDAKKEACGESVDYCGIRRWRFRIPCRFCCEEMVIMTDPENIDYVCIKGAVKLDTLVSTDDWTAVLSAK